MENELEPYVWADRRVEYRVRKCGSVLWLLDSKLPVQDDSRWKSSGIAHGPLCCEILRLAAALSAAEDRARREVIGLIRERASTRYATGKTLNALANWLIRHYGITAAEREEQEDET